MKKTLTLILLALISAFPAGAEPLADSAETEIVDTISEAETTEDDNATTEASEEEASEEATPTMEPAEEMTEEAPAPTEEPVTEESVPTPEPAAEPTEAPAPTQAPVEVYEEQMTITNLYIHGQRVYLSEYPLIENGTLLLPIKEYLENVTRIEYAGTTEVMISAEGHQAILEAGSKIAHLDGNAVNLDVAPIMVGNTLYAPMRFITEHFGYDVNASKWGNVLTVKVGYSQSESYVNTARVTSDTPYLIWVDKSEYKLTVFLDNNGKWEDVYSCIVGIGASSTPTITGTFKFYSLEPRWTYERYYVGPIMRFKGGYAIHSTLLNYDGTEYNGTVGKKISHGCIRVHPWDLSWLTYYVPLQTTVHITE